MSAPTFPETKYFAIHKNTQLYAKVISVFNQVKEVNDQADQLGKLLGGNAVCKKQNRLAGGISAIEFHAGKPSEDWKQVGEKYQNLFYPKAKSKKLEAQINELPTMEYNDMCSVIGFERPQSFCTENSLQWCDCPHIFVTKDKEFIFLQITKGMRYDVPDEMVEINKEQFTLTEALYY